MRAVWRQEEKEQSSFLPYRSEFSNELPAVNAGIVKDNKSVFFNAKGKSVEKVCDLVHGNALLSEKAFIAVVPVNHSEDIESMRPLGRDEDILTAELPAVRHVPFGADMTLVGKVKVYESVLCLYFEFLQLLGLIRIDAAARAYPQDVFLYVYILRQYGKKRLSVDSFASLLEAFRQTSLGCTDTLSV